MVIGPTWQRERGDWKYPRYTLGWDAANWAHANLLQPDGPNAGEPWDFTPEQVRFLTHFYEIDAQGKFKYRRAVLRRLKGWGKDPFGAVICAIEFVGPCRFGGWTQGEHGKQPISVPNMAAWVQTVGVAQDQTKNTFTMFPSLFSKALTAEHHIDVGKTLIYADRGARRIEAITSAAATSEGNRPTFILQNETQHWTEGTGGHAMAAVNARNLAKSRDSSARALAITNAHNPGQDSVAERDYEAYLAISSGRSRATGVLYDSLEAPPEVELADPKSLIAGIEAARGDSHWVNPQRLLEEIYDPNTSPADARRFYLNQIVAAEDAWLTPQEVEAAARTRRVVERGALVTLGFSGLKAVDSCALMACEVESGHIFTLGVWDASANGEVARPLVDSAVAKAFEEYDVAGFYARLDPFQTWVESWESTYGESRGPGLGLCARVSERHPIAVDERARQAWRTKAAEAFHEAVVQGELTHDGHPVAQQHLINARRRPMSNDGIDVQKESRLSPNLIDAARAAILARQARMDYLALPEGKRRSTRVAEAWFA